ncbi:hypothetical protein [Sphingomonas abaci]|uniref:Uncharacterized protein n=1 Tax=Sphingomonas abaci TaxID=237611 RepID=A0A7W7ANT8_9SPHN|nr:hypothetical protein [Sphingomonas abaci]MBB4619544.1 hypothetical protein [Sphingomonas abaci]
MAKRQDEMSGTALAAARVAEMAAIFMIGDGLLGLLQPRRHVALWRSDMAALDSLVRPFAGRVGARRLYGVMQLGAGIALASRLKRPDRLHSQG